MPRNLAEIPSMGGAFKQMRLMRSDRIGALNDLAAGAEPISRFGFVFGDVVIVNKPELIHDVLIAKAKSFEKSPILRSALHPLVGKGIFTSEGDLWKRQRKLMSPMFQHGAIAPFARDMVTCAERAAKSWTHGAVVDISRETMHIAMGIAGKTLFDMDTFSEADDLGAALTVALDWAGRESAGAPLILQARAQIGLSLLADKAPGPLAPLFREWSERLIEPILWPSDRTRELRQALAVLDRRVNRMIADRRVHAAERRDLLGVLLSATDEHGAPAMSDKQVRDEILTLFVAGHETTATALAWALMLLCQHPEAYRRIREEVDAVGAVPSAEALPRLQYTSRVFKEAMRLYPPVYLFGRLAIADVTVGEHLLPKGTVVLMSPLALQRRADLYPDPMRFDPDRFLPEQEEQRHKCAYLPFSAGPRTCLGNYFALMEGPLVLATLLHHADFDLVDPRGNEPDPQATLRPRGAMKMRISLRDHLA